MTLERRFLAAPPAAAAANGAVAGSAPAPGAPARRLIGYAARYGEIADLGPFRERIAPGAFARSLAAGADVLALLDHDPSRVLGRTRSKTLALHDEPAGLRFEISVPETSAGRDALALAARGDLGGASIGFYVEAEARDGEVRVVQRAQLVEVSIVSGWPAYSGTEVEARRGGFSFSPYGAFSAIRATPRLDALRWYLAQARRAATNSERPGARNEP